MNENEAWKDSVELEMAYTDWDSSCREPAVMDNGSLRECRRAHGHEGLCASGFRGRFFTWQRM